MIGYLRGQLLLKKPNRVVVDVNGVGYDVQIPLTTFYELPAEGSDVTLKIHTHVREDALLLFGFQSQKEKDFFLRLISISGVGPKLAIAILSGGRVEELARAISESNLSKITTIPGVGRKTAERLVLELKSHMTPFLLPEEGQAAPVADKVDALQEDIVSALVNLGYPRPAAEKALDRVLNSGDSDRSFEALLRGTLRNLAG